MGMRLCKACSAAFGKKTDIRIQNALRVAEEWPVCNASVGDARTAAYEIIDLAHELSDSTAILVARSVGQAVAAAHMADHAMGAAWYALKAVKSAGKSVETEKKWQFEQLPVDVKELVITALGSEKFKKFFTQLTPASMFGSNPQLTSFSQEDKAECH
jgi:hypothetical protein